MAMSSWRLAGELPRGPQELGRVVHDGARYRARLECSDCGGVSIVVGDALRSEDMILLLQGLEK